MRHTEIIAICRRFGFSPSTKKDVVTIVSESAAAGNEKAQKCLAVLISRSSNNK